MLRMLDQVQEKNDYKSGYDTNDLRMFGDTIDDTVQVSSMVIPITWNVYCKYIYYCV